MSDGVSPRTVDEHLALLTCDRVVERIVDRTGGSREEIGRILDMYATEARYGYNLITPQLSNDHTTILEVGSGLCMLSSYLRMQGYDITALEPCIAGFDLFAEIQAVLLEEAGVSLPILRVKAEELSPKRHGLFQFVFSINVLEHIPNLANAIRGMASVLTPDGHMWHTCPNYAVPYEPHFGVPLVPFFPRATGLLLPRGIAGGELWRSLNFVTYFGLRRMARANNLSVSFRRGTMAEALKRLDSDPEFARRHSSLLYRAHRLLGAAGLLRVIESIPPMLSTPMMVAMGTAARVGPY